MKQITIRMTMDELFTLRDALTHAEIHGADEYKEKYRKLFKYVGQVIGINRKD